MLFSGLTAGEPGLRFTLAFLINLCYRNYANGV